ncbi:hypothetical protein PMI29_05680 [Pseudomonas sp. GM49]|nr:hypothetical protein PMI29_05680 [Pseudomonas sp. GM49]
MSQTGRDYSEKRDFIRMRGFADKKGGLDGRLLNLPVDVKNRLRPDRPSP